MVATAFVASFPFGSQTDCLEPVLKPNRKVRFSTKADATRCKQSDLQIDNRILNRGRLQAMATTTKRISPNKAKQAMSGQNIIIG